MKVKKLDFDKISQLDRIEYSLKSSALDPHFLLGQICLLISLWMLFDFGVAWELGVINNVYFLGVCLFLCLGLYLLWEFIEGHRELKAQYFKIKIGANK